MSKLQHKQLALVLGTTVEGNKVVTLTGIDFERHKVISGISGSGKSTFIAWIAVSLLRQSIPFMIIDPHGSLAKLILTLLSSSDYFRNPKAFDRLWYVDFKRAEKDAAIAFNVLKQPSVTTHTIASNFLEAMHRAFPATGTTTMLDNVIEAACYVLAETNQPVTQLSRLLLDATYREMLLKKIAHPDPLILQFFKSKFEEKASSQLIDSTLRRSFLLTFSPVLRNILSQQHNKIDFSYIINNKISCLFSLGGLDDSTKRLIACMLLVSLEQKFLSMTDIPSGNKTPVHLIVDEAPVFFSQSETSFTNMLEQARKAGATLYYALQTYSQITKGMAGSLQNAISVIMKAGVDDSSTLAGRFYRPVEQAQTVDLFGFSHTPPGLFDNVRNTQEARMIFERLQRQEAIVLVSDKPVKIRTPTLPVKIDQKQLEEVENEYARRLLTPLSHIEREQIASNLVLVASAPPPLATRRSPGPVAKDREPLQLVTGVLDTDILMALYHFHYLTLSQVVRLLGRESSINHVRSKLKKLVEEECVESMTLARSTAGKPPTVYTLSNKAWRQVSDEKGLPQTIPSGEKKHGYLEHTLQVNECLIASVMLPHVEPSITLYDLKHERTLKNSPTKVTGGVYVVPDGWVHLRRNNTEDIGIAFEIDRNTEERDKIIPKINNYVAFASGMYQHAFGVESLTIAFCVSDGGDRRVKQLVTWAEQALGQSRDAAPLFLFGSVAPQAIDPERLFLGATFTTPFDSAPHALVETP